MTEEGLQFDCKFCEATLQAETGDKIKEQGETHLEANHYSDLVEEFSESIAGEPCHNNCGYEFPVGADEVAGLECPSCEHNHFSKLTQQYLFFQLESAWLVRQTR